MQQFILILLRIAMGWLMFYAGITKVLDPAWTSVGYLRGAKTFAPLYQWLALPSNIGWVDALNTWGLVLLGVSLLLGIGVRFSSTLGAVLMLLYYFPVLAFPRVGHGYIVDEHIIYAIVLLFFAAARAGRTFGLDRWCAGLPICRRFPRIHAWFG